MKSKHKTKKSSFIMRVYKSIYDLIFPLIDKVVDDNVFAIAGQSAFFIILSSVPLTMFIVSMLQNLHIPKEVVERLLSGVFSSDVLTQINEFLSDAYSYAAGISLITIIVTLWSAAQGINAMTNGLNRVYNAHENRNWLYRRIRSMIYTILLFVLILLSAVIIVLGSAINNLISPILSILPEFIGMIFNTRYIIIFVFATVIFALIYRNFPNISKEEHKEYKFKYQLPGAFLCSISWYVLSFGISVYVSDFNGFSVYGGLTKLAVIMVWLYFLMVCMMICAEINYVYHKPIKHIMDKKLFVKKNK